MLSGPKSESQVKTSVAASQISQRASASARTELNFEFWSFWGLVMFIIITSLVLSAEPVWLAVCRLAGKASRLAGQYGFSSLLKRTSAAMRSARTASLKSWASSDSSKIGWPKSKIGLSFSKRIVKVGWISSSLKSMVASAQVEKKYSGAKAILIWFSFFVIS